MTDNQVKVIKVSNIIWDTDGLNVRGLPKELNLSVPADTEADEVAEILSEEYSWLVDSLVVDGLEGERPMYTEVEPNLHYELGEKDKRVQVKGMTEVMGEVEPAHAGTMQSVITYAVYKYVGDDEEGYMAEYVTEYESLGDALAFGLEVYEQL